MLTLKQNPDNVFVCDMRVGKKKVPVFWHPKKNAELQNQVEDISVFFTPELRDRFELSRDQADDIMLHMKAGTVSEKNQSKFFKVKKFIQELFCVVLNRITLNVSLINTLSSPPMERLKKLRKEFAYLQSLIN